MTTFPGRVVAAIGSVYEGLPCAGTVTALFGRTDDVHATPHSGLDIANAAGTLLLAPAAGAVRARYVVGDGSAFSVIFGNCVMIDHADDLSSLLAHLLYAPFVVVGERVWEGQPVGLLGSTGQSTGPHVHWGLTRTSLNPSFLKDMGGGVSQLLDPLAYLVAP